MVNPSLGEKIADNAMVALPLTIAESKPEEKDILVKVVVNLINTKTENNTKLKILGLTRTSVYISTAAVIRVSDKTATF